MFNDPARILIAERDPFMRNVLKRTLQEFELDFVEDGAIVLQRVKTHPPGLIILEALLPTLDGFQVCQRLKGDPETRHIPVLFFTLLLAEERAHQVGADAFLIKPARAQVLLDTIHRLLARRPADQGGKF